MVMGKKGMFFTLIGIMIVTLLLVYVTARYGDKLSDSFPTESMRVNQVTNLVRDMESMYLPAAITAVSQNALEGMVDYAKTYSASYSQETPYIRSEFRDDFSDVFMTGKIGRISSGEILFEEETFNPVFDKLISAIWSAYKVDIEYTILSITISQANQFTLNVTIELNYVMTTNEGIKYNRTVNVSALIGIINLRDPWYAYRANVNHPIKLADPDLLGDAVSVKALLDSGNYTSDSKGLSYLERFVGEKDRGPSGLNPDRLGIVSYLSPDPVIGDGADVGSVFDASYADYTFHPWKGTCVDNVLYDVAGVPNFRINSRFVRLLGVTGIATRLVDGSGAPSPPCQSG